MNLADVLVLLTWSDLGGSTFAGSSEFAFGSSAVLPDSGLVSSTLGSAGLSDSSLGASFGRAGGASADGVNAGAGFEAAFFNASIAFSSSTDSGIFSRTAGGIFDSSNRAVTSKKRLMETDSSFPSSTAALMSALAEPPNRSKYCTPSFRVTISSPFFEKKSTTSPSF